MIARLKTLWRYLCWLEDRRMEAAIMCGSVGPLL